MILLVSAVVGSHFVQGPKWPLDPHHYPPTREETDADDDADAPGWDGTDFEAVGAAWKAVVANSRLSAEKRKQSHYRIFVFDRGALYHMHFVPKPDPARPNDVTLGGAIFVVFYKKPFAAKYILSEG